jgi:Ca2+-binding RTX toxin-like protein
MGGAAAHVTVGTAGVSVPELDAIDSGTTAAKPSSTGTGTVEAALRNAIAGDFVAQLAGATHIVTTPIVINVTSSTTGPVGIDLGGAKIFSQITDGSPVVEIIVGPGVDLGGLTLSNFSILGNGREGDGIKIVADGLDRLLHDWTIRNVNVEHVGGIGLDVLGNVSQGTVWNSWMHDDAEGGARFANSAGGGEISALEWLGGGFRKNGIAGLILDNGARDLSVSGAYFVDNDGPGLIAPSGITSVRASGFENNLGSGAIVLDSASFVDDTFATYGRQATAIGGYLAGGLVTLTGVGAEYYGAGSDPTVTANMQGNGTLAIAGAGNVVVGPNIAVTGVLPVGDDSDNTLIGTPDDDVLRGLGGDDILIGKVGADQLDGGGGLDIASYRDATGAVVANLANPALNSGDAAGDSYLAIEGLEGSSFDDNLISGGSGNDVLAGLKGDDTYLLTAGDRVLETAGAGQDLVLARTGFVLAAGQSIEKLYADATGSTAPLDLTGNEQHQWIVGNQGQNRLDSGGGSDLMSGLGGDDTYVVSVGDRVFESAGAGQDLVLARTSFILEAGQSIENLYADATGSMAALDLTGNDAENVLIGNQGANVLDGGDNADMLLGLGGADRFSFATAPGPGNVDTILDFVHGTDIVQLSAARFGLAPGALATSNFKDIASGSLDADDRIVHDSNTGALFLDADGSGSAAAQQFATLAGYALINQTDFLIV